MRGGGVPECACWGKVSPTALRAARSWRRSTRCQTTCTSEPTPAAASRKLPRATPPPQLTHTRAQINPRAPILAAQITAVAQGAALPTQPRYAAAAYPRARAALRCRDHGPTQGRAATLRASHAPSLGQSHDALGVPACGARPCDAPWRGLLARRGGGPAVETLDGRGEGHGDDVGLLRTLLTPCKVMRPVASALASVRGSSY
jgi:hypothetical protein